MDCEKVKNDDDYSKDLPHTPKEWQKWKDENRAKKRKWKEEKQIKMLEKKKKKEEAEETELKEKEEEDKKKEEIGRKYTVSIALPGSILDNAQTPELRTYLAGQIARAVVVFKVDEIIIFDESGTSSKSTEGDYHGIGKKGGANIQMARILQYLECPQYLRKSFFPQHKDLQYAGLLNPLDCGHHVKAEEESPYREGVIVDIPPKEGKGSYANVGLYRPVMVDRRLQPGIRVTVRMSPGYIDLIGQKKKTKGTVVSPTAPRTDAGLYWGYSVRLASSLSAVFTESPYQAGYDVTIGTSERGSSVDDFKLENFSHMLLVFGGVKGLECSLDVDQDLHIEDPKLLFDHYLNTCPDQGSNTIRTEEAILITLATLRPKFMEPWKKAPDVLTGS